MQRFFAFVISVGLALVSSAQSSVAADGPVSAYTYHFKPLSGTGDLALAQFKGKVILIVNTASKCGFTKQYAGLQTLYDTYRDRGLVVIGVPSNDFGAQEPGSSSEIAHFCQLNYGVTFPMASKEVVSGKAAHPFYVWARQSLGAGAAPRWNFHKYLLDRQGRLVGSFSALTDPGSKKLAIAIEDALKTKP